MQGGFRTGNPPAPAPIYWGKHARNVTYPLMLFIKASPFLFGGVSIFVMNVAFSVPSPLWQSTKVMRSFSQG